MNAAETAHTPECPGLEHCAGECATEPGLRPWARVHAGQEDPYIWQEEVAALLGISEDTVRHYAWLASTQVPGPGVFPVPERREWRHVLTKSGRGKRVESPQWRLSVIRAYQEHKRGPGGRPVQEAAR